MRRIRNKNGPQRFEVTAKIDGIGVIKHLLAMPESESKTQRDAIAGRFSRVYPNRAVSILRIVERR